MADTFRVRNLSSSGRERGQCARGLNLGPSPTPGSLCSPQDFAVSTVPVSGASHLRGLCGMGGPRTVVAGSSDAAQKAVRVRRGGTGGEGVASVGVAQAGAAGHLASSGTRPQPLSLLRRLANTKGHPSKQGVQKKQESGRACKSKRRLKCPRP